MKRTINVSGLINAATLACLLSALPQTNTAAAPHAELAAVSGSVIVQRGQVYMWNESSVQLKPKDTLIVLQNSSATVKQGNCTLSIPENSVYTLEEFPDCISAQNSVVSVEPTYLPTARRAPGSIEVDPDAAERALERTLTQQGALVLPPGRLEIAPGVVYTYEETDRMLLADLNGDLVAIKQQSRRNNVAANLDLKLGLPWDSQLELGIPYHYVDQSQVTDFGGASRASHSGDASGFGDFYVSLAKTLVRQSQWRPDLLFRLRYDTGSGSKGDGLVPLSGGYSKLQGQLTALKRQDPLAFVGSLSYANSFESNGVRPGDEIGLSLGAVLAASPETSLQFRLSQIFTKEIQINGRKIPESDKSQGLLSLGTSSILGKGVMLNVSAGVGLSDSAPDYFFSFSLPVRLDHPVF